MVSSFGQKLGSRRNLLQPDPDIRHESGVWLKDNRASIGTRAHPPPVL